MNARLKTFNESLQESHLYFPINSYTESKKFERLKVYLDDRYIPYSQYVNGIVINNYKDYTTDVTISGVSGIEVDEVPVNSRSEDFYVNPLSAFNIFKVSYARMLANDVINTVLQDNRSIDINFKKPDIRGNEESFTVSYSGHVVITYIGGTLDSKISDQIVQEIKTKTINIHKTTFEHG